MKVDLELEDDEGGRTLIDTSYKEAGEGSSHYGVSREDFYRMYSYARPGKRDYDQIVLLYPSRTPIRKQFEAPEATLYVRSIDLRALRNPADGTLVRAKAMETLNAALGGIGSALEN